MDRLKKEIATFGSIGNMPFPGTMASIVAMLLFFLINSILKNEKIVLYYSLALAPLFSILCLILSAWAEQHYKQKDPKQMVLDDLAGYFLSTIVFMPHQHSFYFIGFWAFALFRFFDILKPFPIKKLEKFKSGWGILLDDIMAGVYANIVLNIILYTGVL